jgi:hypothetical protein
VSGMPGASPSHAFHPWSHLKCDHISIRSADGLMGRGLWEIVWIGFEGFKGINEVLQRYRSPYLLLLANGHVF